MDPDEKKHIEATHKKNGFIVSYQGADAAEMSTDVASGARIRTQLVFKSYSPFLEGVRGSCEANRYGFPTVKAISADEANQSLLKDREATYGVSMNVPRVGKLIESVTVKAGVSNWRRNLRVLGYVPVVGQTLRAMEWKLGPAKWNRFVEALDERLPTGVLTLKAALTSPYILAVLGIVAFSELKSGGAGDKNK